MDDAQEPIRLKPVVSEEDLRAQIASLDREMEAAKVTYERAYGAKVILTAMADMAVQIAVQQSAELLKKSAE